MCVATSCFKKLPLSYLQGGNIYDLCSYYRDGQASTLVDGSKKASNVQGDWDLDESVQCLDKDNQLV